MTRRFYVYTKWLFVFMALYCFSHEWMGCTPQKPDEKNVNVVDASEPKTEKAPIEPRSESTTPDKKPPEQRSVDQDPVDQKPPTKPLDAPLAEDETRVGQIKKQSECITGPEAVSQIGDWRIYNKHVAFVIHGVSHSRFFSGAKGHVVDASTVDANGKAAHDLLEEVFAVYGILRVVQATSIRVVEPGGPGKRAVLRVTATDVGIPIIDVVINSRPFTGKIELDYILEPGARHLQIVTRVTGGERLADQQMGDGLLLGDRTRQIAPLIGWDVKDAVRKPIEWFGAVGRNASYLIAPADPKGRLTIPITQASLYPAFGGVAKEFDESSEYKRWLFVGDGRWEATLEHYRAARKVQGLKVLQGTIKGLKKPQLADLVLLNEKGKAVSQTHADEKGSFRFSVPQGSYTVRATMPGYLEISQKTDLSSSVALEFKTSGTLQISLKEIRPDGAEGGFVPARVQFSGARSFRFELIQDNTKIPVPPGEYTVTISRGLEYEYWQKKIDFRSKDGKDVLIQESVSLKRVVDTSGYVGSDMHLHASPSLDSTYPLEGRVSSLVTEGLHFAVSTDHDRFTDYAPTVQKLGLSEWLQTAIGQEVSPLAYHFNTFPLQKLPTDEPVYFAAKWAQYDGRQFEKVLSAPSIWATLRKQYQVPIIQLNHPRGSQALLNYVKYDPKKGMKAIPEGTFNANWDTIELYNGNGLSTFLNTTIHDWFSFINQGMYKTGVGNSDSHSAGARPGFPRTLIASSTQAGQKIQISEVMKSLKESRAIVYAGPYIKLLVDGKLAPGERVKGPSMKLDIEISAPSWIPVSYVKVYANGVLTQTFQVPASKDVIRFKKVLTLTPSRDTHYVVMAGDDKNKMKVVYDRLPVSLTNPVYLDIKGDGFTPPGLP